MIFCFIQDKLCAPDGHWARNLSRPVQLTKISPNFKIFSLQLKKKSEDLEQNCVWLFHYFHFERNYDFLKSKSPCILLNKNIDFNKNKTESKMENPTHSFTETNLVLQLI